MTQAVRLVERHQRRRQPPDHEVDPVVRVDLFGSDDGPVGVGFEKFDEPVKDRFGPFHVGVDDEIELGSVERPGPFGKPVDAVSLAAVKAQGR